MSFNRKKNPYTLGDFLLQPTAKKRNSQTALNTCQQLPDLFERDPFKVQSYNFRYAEANFPLQTPYLCCDKYSAGYNHPYSLQQPNYHETRRRKFVQTSSSIRPSTYAEAISRNYTASRASQMRPERNNDCFHGTCGYSMGTYGPYTAPGCSNMDPYADRMCPYNSNIPGNKSRSNSRLDTSRSRSSIGLQKKTSNQSLCEINIKIKCSQDNLLSDNITINIASDKNNIVRTGNTPCSTKSFVVKPASSKGSATILIKRPSRQSLRSDSLSRNRDLSLTSVSSSDYEETSKATADRIPQFINIRQFDRKVNAAKTAMNKQKTSPPSEKIPFSTPPWMLAMNSQREKSTLCTKPSNQTILNNLNILESRTKCSQPSRNIPSAESRKQGMKRSATCFEPYRPDNTKIVGSSVKQRRSGSAIRKTESISKMSVKMNTR